MNHLADGGRFLRPMYLPFFKKKTHHSLYTLLISKSVVGACSFHVENGSVIVDSTSSLVAWDEENENTLFDAADTAIGSLSAAADQVLLSLPDDWVQGQGIHPRRKPLLKSLTEKLEISSVGFVVTMEALIAFLKEESPQPLNLVCASIEPDAFIMGIVKQDVASPILRIGRSGKTADDFLEGCSRLKVSEVPPQILIVSLSESNEALGAAKQELETYAWDQSIFVQTPSVALQTAEFLLVAVASSGGKEVAKAMPELSNDSPSSTESEAAPAPNFVPVTGTIAPTPTPIEPESDPELQFHEDDANTPASRSRKKIAMIIALVVIFLGIVTTIATAVVLPRLATVEVTVTRSKSPIETKMTITVDSAPSASSSGAVVTGEVISIGVSGSKDAPTTGKKQTGDKAGGTVTLFNKTTQSKKFPSGTQLKTGKLIFVTTEEVTVASASASISETVNGKATVKAAADFVGEEGNIDKNKELSVSTYDASAYIARTETSFTGGTSRTEPAVAAKDQEMAVNTLLPELKEKATSELQSRIGGNQDGILLGDVTIGTKKFDKAVGEEAQSVSVTMSASSSALLYKRDDVLAVITKELEHTLPPGATLDADHLTLSAAESKKISNTKASVDFTISGKTNARIDTEQFVSILAGKNLEEAKTFLDSQKSIESYTMKLKPSLFTAILRQFPSDPAKINVKVQE
jgi:hypothetical protein